MSDAPKKLKDLRVADLKVELEKRSLQTSGVKAVLADRLKTALEAEGFDVNEYTFNDETDKEEAGEDNEDEAADNEDEATEGEEAAEVAESEMQPEAETEGNEEEEEEVENPEEGKDEMDSVSTEEKDSVPTKEKDSVPTKEKDSVPTKEKDSVPTKEKDSVPTKEKDSVPTKEKKPEETKETVEEGTGEEKEGDEDSLNIMVGDEDNLFGEEEKVNGVPGSPPRPETAPVKHPFTVNDTISLGSRSQNAPSENSSMRVNPDESQSVASHDSDNGVKENGAKTDSSSVTDQNKDDAPKTDKPSHPSIRNLWVSGLTSTTKAAELKTVFTAHGKVSGAKIVTNARTSGARCFGYVTMNTPEDAAKCIEKLNKTELGGSMIVVEWATADSGPNRQEKKDDLKLSVDAVRKSSSRDVSKRDDRHRGHSSHRPHDVGVHRPHENNAHRGTDVRRSDSGRGISAHRPGSIRRDDRPTGPVLTFNHIRDQRKREQDREEERRRREREKRRLEDEERKRKEALRRQREEEEKLRREREELKREREKLEREKQELMRFERDRQRMEREKLEREKEELERLRRQQLSMRGGEDRRGSKRPAEDRDPYMADRKRTGHREEFAGGNRGNFEIGSRRSDDRAGVPSRYNDSRSSRDMMGSRDTMSAAVSRNVVTVPDMGSSRGSGSSRDHGGSRDYRTSSRDMGGSSRGGVGSRDQGGARDSGRMGGSDYRSSRTGPSHGASHVNSSSGSRGIGGSHGGSHSGTHGGSSRGGGSHAGGSHGGSSHSGSAWSTNKSSGNFSSGGNFTGNQGNLEWNRGGGIGGGIQAQNRSLPLSGLNLPIGSIPPFSPLVTSAFMNPMSGGASMGGGGGSIGGGGSSSDRYDGYSTKPMMNNTSRRY